MKKQTKKLLLTILIIIVIFIYNSYTEKNKVSKREVKPVNYTNNLNIYFLDVGQADAILIRDNNNNILVDAGNNEDGTKLVTYFNDLGIESFDYVIGTHAHEDHIGGMDDIIKNFDIKNFFMPSVISTSKTFEDVLDALLEKNIKFQTPKINDEYQIHNTKIEILYVGDKEGDLNNTSIVTKITYGNNTFLLMGDATSTTERVLLKENKNIKSDLLKLGHHGSKYSTTDNFLEAVNPKYAIISAGKNNIYKHPEQVTLDKLKASNIKTYRTDLDGTILVKSDGNTISIETIDTDTNG